ncbi:hypothetical protein [Microvirga vignae]|uniref:hypothetical protein n=1 Tax=Microvirga vignae TaxID=1225564 RepID=UPI00191024BC
MTTPLPEYPTPEYGIYVVRPPGSYVPGKVRVLIDMLVERFGGTPEWDRYLAGSGDGKHVSRKVVNGTFRN